MPKPKPCINFNKCHGCGMCVAKCANSVLDLRALEPKEINSLNFFGRARAKSHPMKAYVKHPQKCTTCVSCEMVCKHSALHIKEWE